MVRNASHRNGDRVMPSYGDEYADDGLVQRIIQCNDNVRASGMVGSVLAAGARPPSRRALQGRCVSRGLDSRLRGNDEPLSYRIPQPAANPEGGFLDRPEGGNPGGGEGVRRLGRDAGLAAARAEPDSM